MKWVDVAGPPASGKSSLCDPLWGPHAIPIEDRLPPASWHDWLNEVSRLFHLIREHPTLPAAIRMTNRSVRKIATVARMRVNEELPDDYAKRIGGHKVYIQTALAQRGLGFGWRMNDLGIDLNELRHYFRLMPVSIGVAVTRCPQEIVAQRNRDREKVKATAHENRAHMLPLMAPAIELAIEVLRERGVSVLEVDTTQPIEAARAQLVEFANRGARDAKALGSGREMAPMSSPPPWWVGPGGSQPVPLGNPGSLWRPYEGQRPDR